ncbi:hypothetical protein AC249_AIPGENE3826 [Exaiptasia diaphana]|nr:hypothetical protein AC249_AIPGENE3826 [Exaiptasia diaphana]
MMGTFFTPTIVCLIYSSYVKDRVIEIEEAYKSDSDNYYPPPVKKNRKVFHCCLSQLAVRFLLRIIFSTILQLIWYGGFPSHFSCQLQDNSHIPCVNSAGPRKRLLLDFVVVLHIFYALFLLLELSYLIYKRRTNYKFQFDSLFCPKYLNIPASYGWEESLGSNN